MIKNAMMFGGLITRPSVWQMPSIIICLVTGLKPTSSSENPRAKNFGTHVKSKIDIHVDKSGLIRGNSGA